jgi:helicase
MAMPDLRSLEAPSDITFPLVQRAEALGILDGKSALIIAPTATGKSYIGRLAIQRALDKKTGATHAYLVPFRSLAAEVYDQFLDLFGSGSGLRLRIATGDHRDALRPEESDLIVATYESFAGLLRTTEVRPGIIVADEVHLVADPHRGPVVEGLFARLLSMGRIEGLCALSAVVENAREIAAWLGVDLLEGGPQDRPVELLLEHRAFSDSDEALLEAVEPCSDGAQALVFCSSRAGAEKVARTLTKVLGEVLATGEDACALLSGRIHEADPGLDDLRDMVLSGVAYHHAGLVKNIRRGVEQAFRDGAIRIITCTPTLAAGVNLPAEIVVVRDVFRTDVLRGRVRRILLPSGEILNMMGRAGRPHQATRGVGIALIPEETMEDSRVLALQRAIENRTGGIVRSQLPMSFDAMMRFVLSVVVERGEATSEDVAASYRRTLAYCAEPEEIRFDRSFEEDMMEDIPSYEKVVKAKGAIRLKSHRPLPDGVHATVVSEKKGGRKDTYEVVIGITGIECSCPAASQWHRTDICKHAACAIHTLLFEPGIDPEARARAIYNCGEVFARTLDVGTKLKNALEILSMWRLLERAPAGWRATPMGVLAAGTWFDLLLVRVAVDRVAATRMPAYDEIARWAVEDYFAEEKKRDGWAAAVEDWLAEVDAKKIALPSRYRGDFEQGLDDLARVCRLYESAAYALGKEETGKVAHQASHALRYGVAPELVPLMALRFPQLGRARCRFLFDKGVQNVGDLAGAEVDDLADPRRLPGALVLQWIKSAREVQKARDNMGTTAAMEADPEFDELVARFHLDPAALAG